MLSAMKKNLHLLILIVFMLLGRLLQAQVSVTATAGTTGPTAYTTLKGAFDAINAGTHQGAVTITISGNTTETATASLNASGSGSASFSSVLIKPASASSPVVSGAIASGPIVRFNGASHVTIDGSNNGTSSRDLSLVNTSASSSNVMLIGSSGSTFIDDVKVRNTILQNGTNTSTALICGDGGVTGNPGYFSNVTIENNDIRRAYIGIYCYATVSATDNALTIKNNLINSSGTDAIRLVGIYCQGVKAATISGNTLGNFETTSAEFDRAIWLATACSNVTVSGNTITNMAYSGTSSYGPIGINISPGIANANIQVTDNILSNLSSSGTGTTMGIFSYSAGSQIVIANNKLSTIKNTNTGGYGAAGIILANTITTANTSVYNNFVSDVTGYGYNGYGSGDNGNGIVVDGGGGYDIDFNTVSLNANQTSTGNSRASCVLVTANTTSSGSVRLRNNILANTQSVGDVYSRLVISNVATTGTAVFSTINYNNYYSTSGNLSSLGTNASITSTLAGLQTSFGGNANSKSILPVFISTSDLHLDRAANNALNASAVTIAGITKDIDGDTRSATPDMGADEFTPCVAVSFTSQPVNAIVCANSDTAFHVVATNAISYQWQVNAGSGFNDVSNGTVYSGATSPDLHLTSVPLTYNGYIYRCLVKSASDCNFYSNTATLTVRALPNATATPASQTTCSGPITTIALSSTASGATFTWTRDHNADVTGIAASGSGDISGALTNTTGSDITVTFTITPLANGCAGTPIIATVTLTANASITCPSNIVTGNTPNTCGATVTYAPTLVALTNADLTYTFTGATTGTGSGSGSGMLFNIGTTTVSLTGSSSCGSASCSFTVTVNDTQNPVITCPAPVTVSCAGAVPAPDAAAITATDNCPGTTVSFISDVISGQTCANRYLITRTYRAKDAAGNTTDCTQTITVNDVTAPTITCPSNISIATPSNSCVAVVNFNVTATDNCSGAVTVVSTPASGSSFPVGTTMVTSVATDACGNSSTCTFTVTVTDSQKPVISGQPLSTTVCEGTNATFTVAAAPANSYQWQVNSGAGFTDISGATASTLTVSNVSMGMSGNQYRVVVQGPCTSTTSSAATLTVNSSPVVSLTAGPLTSLMPGQTTTLTANYNHPGNTFNWYLNGSLYQVTNTNVLTGVDVDAIGDLYVTFTDENGCSGTSNTVTLKAKQDFQFFVYPVPNDGHFAVRFYAYTLGVKRTLRVWDSKGTVVFSKEFTMNNNYERMDVDISKYAAGPYHVELQDAGGKLLGSTTIVVVK